jgi:penicillin-binding protein 2
VLTETEPKPGHDVVLTIDSQIQKVAEKALSDAMTDAHRDKYPHARAGALVALDVRNGEVLAMASLPTYDPAVFLGGVSESQWKTLTSKQSDYPLQNRAISGQYPPASTFKAFTGLAGLEYGVARQWGTYNCAGKWIDMGEQWKKYCWKRTGHGTISFMGGIEQSCDTVFYEIGYEFYKRRKEEIQKTARSFGFGSTLGIDLPGEMHGRVPDARWKKAFNEDYPEYQRWLPGDTVNLAIGQGDMLVTPLQLAAAYGGIANGGIVMRPHILRSVLGSDGKPVLATKAEVAMRPAVSERNIEIMDSALRAVTRTGTAKGAFGGFGPSAAGKTGTAEVAKKDDYAWFVGYAPASDPKYVVAVVIEQGGHGGSVAAPAARQVLDALLGEKITHVQATDVSR